MLCMLFLTNATFGLEKSSHLSTKCKIKHILKGFIKLPSDRHGATLVPLLSGIIKQRLIRSHSQNKHAAPRLSAAFAFILRNVSNHAKKIAPFLAPLLRSYILSFAGKWSVARKWRGKWNERNKKRYVYLRSGHYLESIFYWLSEIYDQW